MYLLVRSLTPFHHRHPRHSSETALLKATSDFHFAKPTDCFSVLILLDLAGAFDPGVDHSLHPQILPVLGSQDIPLAWFFLSFLLAHSQSSLLILPSTYIISSATFIISILVQVTIFSHLYDCNSPHNWSPCNVLTYILTTAAKLILFKYAKLSHSFAQNTPIVSHPI